ncbi:hypothetical protein [Enterovirga rhinocerotis]|uniref:Uncharacterized protein n=1 Tax=Enterovirga rhinocerotis TaxID=1339210 RepID=A0A4R7C495_9HYPH|nr:hypothetical protein [Enterovirga rhinocerotis]TDR93340.1 hypothetical protein EV668_0598 [Enterovirga rhinocerotis]
MPTGRTDELEQRFGSSVASAITAAYLATIERTSGPGGVLQLSTDERLAIVRALVREAENGRADARHLVEIALATVQRARGAV